jgi:peptide/nickel transport system permease protein
MGTYILRRLILLPFTLLCIILINFVIVNLAPGDPTSITEVSAESGAARRQGASGAFGGDMRYLQFREHYGLTLPILFNTWPYLTQDDVDKTLKRLDKGPSEMSVKDYDALRVKFGDQARFIMPKLLHAIHTTTGSIQKLAIRFFVRGGTGQAIIRPYLTDEEKGYNKIIAANNLFLIKNGENKTALTEWYEKNKEFYHFEPTSSEALKEFFFSTRIYRYLSRVLTLDFGTMRNDQNKLVTREVSKRFKYSLTLSIIPMLLTLVLCQVFGFLMAYQQHRPIDLLLNFIFLVLYAIPVFVAAPFLIEKVALNHTFPWTNIPIPISGFTSPEGIYENFTSKERFFDILRHIFLPIIAVMYGGLAAQTRLSRTAVLEVLRQDYLRTAKAKGLSTFPILHHHVARNAGITIVTSVASSLGVVLGGTLIVETLFDINGFGKFFYEAVINRDYNVIMFSAIAGSFLTLIGYLIADVAYTVLDPRVSLE